MNFGWCMPIPRNAQGQLDRAALAAMRADGFDYADFHIADVASLTPDEADQLRRWLDAEELKCLAGAVFLPAGARLFGPEADEAQLEEHLERAFDRTARLGMRKLGFGSGGARRRPEGMPISEGRERLTELIREKMAPRAAANGQRVVLEPLRPQECNVVNTLAEGAAIVQAVGHPAVGLLADTWHMLATGEAADDLRLAMPTVGHVHVSGRERFLPVDEMPADLAALLHLIRDAGYQDTFSFEVRAPIEQRAPALRLLKQTLAN